MAPVAVIPACPKSPPFLRQAARALCQAASPSIISSQGRTGVIPLPESFSLRPPQFLFHPCITRPHSPFNLYFHSSPRRHAVARSFPRAALHAGSAPTDSSYSICSLHSFHSFSLAADTLLREQARPRQL